MPRVYQPKDGSKRLKQYSEETLELCLSDVVEGKISANKAAKKYKIPKGTLINRMHGRHIKNHGGQIVFTKNEEEEFVDVLLACAKWGFPLNALDLRLIAKAYLDRNGKDTRFKNNFPGSDWAKGFLKRHAARLRERMSNNIKRSRAAVSAQVMTDFFNELSITLEGVSPGAIFNYDESNLSDDPGKKKLIFERGVKYPDNVVNFSKSAVTIMVCASATGDILPPYVVYKATHLWDSWREGGPKGAPCCEKTCCTKGSRYNRSNHGWFDTVCFTDWFKTCFLPHAKLIEGKKVLIGDNLSSHFTKEVINLCKTNNIDFVCLPPNATHICQPLDVSFFGPMKNYWKQLLVEWKKSNPKSSSVEKSIFPRLLKNLFDKMSATARQNVVSGFLGCGIYPLSKTKMLSKVPSKEVIPNTSVSDVLLDFLKDQRNPEKKTTSTKRKKLNVIPGRSVAAEDTPEKTNDAYLPSTSKTLTVKRQIMGKDPNQSDSDCEDFVNNSNESSDTDDLPLIQLVDRISNDEVIIPDELSAIEQTKQNIKIGSWVVVEYITKKTIKHYVGEVISTNIHHEVKIKFVKKYKSIFVWPEKEDLDEVPISDIKKVLNSPQIGRRGELSFENDLSPFDII